MVHPEGQTKTNKTKHKRIHDSLLRMCCPLQQTLCVFICQTEPQAGVSARKVYGESLLSHLKDCGQEIAAPIQECVTMLLKTGLREEVSQDLQTQMPKLCIMKVIKAKAN